MCDVDMVMGTGIGSTPSWIPDASRPLPRPLDPHYPPFSSPQHPPSLVSFLPPTYTFHVARHITLASLPHTWIHGIHVHVAPVGTLSHAAEGMEKEVIEWHQRMWKGEEPHVQQQQRRDIHMHHDSIWLSM